MMNPNANPEGGKLRFFTSTEVAGMLRMNTQVIARKLLKGEIEGYKLGKDWRVSESQLLRFLDKNRNNRKNPSTRLSTSSRS